MHLYVPTNLSMILSRVLIQLYLSTKFDNAWHACMVLLLHVSVNSIGQTHSKALRSAAPTLISHDTLIYMGVCVGPCMAFASDSSTKMTFKSCYHHALKISDGIPR